MKKFTYMVLGLIGVMGTLLVGVANAETISYSLSGHEGTYYANDLELYYLRNAETVFHYTIMDRNLGASDVYNGNWDSPNTGSYGYVYQRGNNYGFSSTSDSFTENSTGVQVPKSVRSGYSPSLYWNNVRYLGGDSWMGSGNMYDNIWGGAGDTVENNGAGTDIDRQGPCPVGYHVPSIYEWKSVKYNWSDVYFNRNSRRTDFAYDLLLPPAGVRKSGSEAFQAGHIGEYRTSSPRRDSNTGAYVLYFYENMEYNTTITDTIAPRSMGDSLRCFKNDFQSGGNLEFHLNGGGYGVVAVSDGKFTSMPDLSRSVSIFEGWYTTPDFQTGTKLGVGSGTDGIRDLYAKWGCIEGYVLSGDACVPGTKVTFNIDGFSQSVITVPYGTVLDFSGEVVNLPDGTAVTITGVADAHSEETFVGWGTGNNNRWPKRTIKTLVIPDGESNITLHAIFRGNLTITFNATKNGGETDTPSISVPYGTVIDLSGYTASKSGGVRTFLGWNTDSDATGGLANMYKAENEDSNGIELYAIFRKDKFYVNFETNGHGDTPSTQTINRGDYIVNPGNLTEPGYNFEGWSDNEYLTTNFDFGIAPTDDVTLYAKWRVPGEECYEGFEYDNNLGMCIKNNEWVVRVGLDGGIIISSGYSDFLEELVSLLITGDYKSKMGNFDIAKNYYGVTLAGARSNNVLHMGWNGSLDTGTGNMVRVFEGPSGSEGDLLFTMATKASCRGDEPNCKFYNQNIEVAEGIPDWYNLKLFLSENIKQGILGGIEQVVGPITGIVRADNLRIIFDPRVVVTFDSNGHGVSPERQILNKGSRITNPGSLSAEGYKFVGWSDNEYLISTFDFNTAVNKDTTLYAKWESLGGGYSCPEGQEYDESVGLCKKPADWVIRIGYNGDMELSSGYSSFLDYALLSGLDLGMTESEVEAFKKAFGILMAVSEIFDSTDEIMIDEDTGIVANGDFWLLDYYNKNGKFLFTVEVDMSGTESHSSGWSIQLFIHTRSTSVNVARGVSSSDNLKLTPSSTGINQYVAKYPPIEQLENIWIIFSDRMELNENNGGYSGGGGHSQGGSNEGNKVDENSSEESQNNNTDTNSSDNSSQEGGEYSDEFQQAYEFAYKNGITTMDTIDKADMQGSLTRIAMAKMLSNYAINVLGKKPANIVVPNFTDITAELDEQYDYGVTLGYQLGIMGINMPNNKFRPHDLVTRAEFVTALSRMLFSTPDGDPYYITHLAKLKEEGIITNDDPSMKELRGYVMIMLMRAAKN